MARQAAGDFDGSESTVPELGAEHLRLRRESALPTSA
jgi:hypothetical protein